MNRYTTQLESINNAISKFEELIEKTDNSVMKNVYETTLEKLEKIKEIFVNTYSWYR